PRTGGKLTSSASGQPESIAHIWLRLHPREIGRLFPQDTVFTDGNPSLAAQMRVIASAKFTSSWHAGMNAMIPAPKDLTVDVDLPGGPRRFFMVNTEAQTAEYAAGFEKRFVPPPPAFTSAKAQEAFDKFWEAFDRDYAMFVLRPEVDWTKLREQYRPKALAAASAYEFAGVCAEMLKPLRDLHVWLTLGGAEVPVFNRPRSANANPAAYPGILGRLNQAGSKVRWTVTEDKIGYLVIDMWNDGAIPARCDEVLEEMRDTRGLIVDVRLNGGGSEDQALEVAGRFLARQFVYAYSQFRNGPSHTNLTAKIERTVQPRGPWRYNRPVVLLIGQKCISSNESFVAMMSGDPDLTTMGDHTCGSSGNPRIVQLPFSMTVSVPRWIDYLPDGTPLDERGFTPKVQFQPRPGAFEGKRDDLLTAALERLRQVPLPDKPIEGPAVGSAEAGGPANLKRPAESLPNHSAEAREEAQDTSRPKVVSVVPAADAQDVAPVTELRVRFDRPMDPLSLKLKWESGGFFDCDVPQYDTNRYEFTIPVRLAAGALHQVVVNPPFIEQKLSEARKQWPLDGFQSADHHLAGLFAWRFRTQATPPPAPASPPKAITIVPPPRSQVAQVTFVEIQFDQPMAPPEQAFPYLVAPPGAARPEMIPYVKYDAAKRTFRIPLVLKAKEPVRFTLAGLRSADGLPAEPIKLEYRTTAEEFSQADQARMEAAAKE
ncbi:MAG TPA: S41 family peptidase, partial [Bacillota bacterium]|nr:S41 family peptidase [Bacillota bacterium]